MSMNPFSKPSHARLLWVLALLTTALVLTVTPVAAHEGGVHVVQPGETLSQIAQRYGTDVATLRRLNNLGDVDFVWSGQRLAVPLADGNGTTGDPAPAAQEEVSVYVVQPGDTLSGVAVAFQTSLAHLVELNGIYPGQRLLVGQELRVPARGSGSPAPTQEAASVELPVNHVVQPGEHLGVIAERYGTTPRAIIQANNLANPSIITPGQTLIVPPPSLAERVGMQSNQQASQTAQGYHVHSEFPTTTEKWIDVDLSEQRVVAYEGTQPVRSFIVSTGLPGTPTVTGTFRIWAKTPLQDMYGGNRAAGDYYYLEDVPWVQYFYEDYAFHGTYWHNNFGRPMSRGCVNMTIEDAKWLFDWASPAMDRSGWLFSDADNPGTLVLVHQ